MTTLIERMARTLWLMAYADRYEQLREDGGVSEHVMHAGPGEDWDDCVPETPDAARMLAWRLVGMFEEANHTRMASLVELAFALVAEDQRDDSKLGHYLVMRALGHGVSWEDDHPAFGCVYPMTATELHYELSSFVDESFALQEQETQEDVASKGGQ